MGLCSSLAANVNVQREKRRKELAEKEKEKAELEKKELELARIKLQLQEKEAKDKADADRKKAAEAQAAAEIEQAKGEDAKTDAEAHNPDSDDESENLPTTSTTWIQVSETTSWLDNTPAASESCNMFPPINSYRDSATNTLDSTLTMTLHSPQDHAISSTSLITWRACSFTIMYTMLHSYFLHLYVLLSQLIPGDRKLA